MKKQLGIFATVFALCASALIWSGCSNYCCDKAPVECAQPCPTNYVPCPQPCAPECAPVHCDVPCPRPCAAPCAAPCPKPCAPKPCAKPCAAKPAPACEELCKKPAGCKYPNSVELQRCEDGIIVKAKQPPNCLLGDTYPFDIDVQACKDVCDAVVKVHVGDGVTILNSEPKAEIQGQTAVFNVGSMNKGDCRLLKLNLRCECEGEQCVCVCATAVPVRFCSLVCAKPILVCEKCGPEEVSPGDNVNYSITVTNRGSAAAEKVVITDQIPPELEDAQGRKTITFDIGTLAPCETRKVGLCLKAVKRGKACNTAVVTACNADTVSCQFCTLITKICVDCTKTGPKEVQMGKTADYVITVTNIGDKVLNDVVVTDNAPSQTSISAAQGAQVNGNTAIWKLKQLKPGEKATFNLSLTTCVPGCFTNKANVTTCEGCNANCQFTTRWRGRPALEMCPDATEDLICVGDSTAYNVTIQNKGTEPDTNVVLVVRFPEGVQPTQGSGASKADINGSTVTFAPVATFAPRQTIQYRVDAKGVKAGDARVTFELTSDSVKSAITSQVNTVVN